MYFVAVASISILESNPLFVIFGPVGMKAGSRSESMNAYFDGYVNSMTSLSEFIEQYDKAVLDRRFT
ncbi:hypothetical protein OROMI_030963 [Orobanche minor]